MEFEPFEKIFRLNRDCIATEKIDGTNALVAISDDLEIKAGSRSRWITPENDNMGFAKWVEANKEDLKLLGPGFHYGEWWGSGIQRGYGLQKGEKRFSLFNATRWADPDVRPKCCRVVPILGYHTDINHLSNLALEILRTNGSMAEPGFMKPEGIVIYHTASGHLYKVTLEKDEVPKTLVVK